ncbi:MAG: hypothetical protein ACFBSD_12560 [Paracoccaceae bacterium]
MRPPPPEKFLMVPDDYHLNRLGRLEDGRFCFQSTTIWADRPEPPYLDYVCSFIFDADGGLTEHQIDLLGRRGEYSETKKDMICDRHSDKYGPITPCSVWVRPFSVDMHGTRFGFVATWVSDDLEGEEADKAMKSPAEEEDGHWAVIFEPGKHFVFYEPWDSGVYDT